MFGSINKATKFDGMDLGKLSKAALLLKCNELNITRCKSKTKKELIELINNKTKLSASANEDEDSKVIAKNDMESLKEDCKNIDNSNFETLKDYYDNVLNLDKSTYKSSNDEPTPISCIRHILK